MSVTIKGDHGFDNKPSIEAKALRINLNPYIYGTFAEIGAGQEVARHFFKVGGSSGTIAKTISAYDKNFSDTIYGEEADGRSAALDGEPPAAHAAAAEVERRARTGTTGGPA